MSCAADLSSLLDEAAEPSTPPGRLQRLAANPDPRLPRTVACNPGAPRDLVLSLLETYPAEALRNPILPLWLLEQPDLLRQRPRTIASLLAIDLPPWMISTLHGYWSEHSTERSDLLLGKWLARRRDTPPWLLGRLCTSGHAGTRFAASRHPEAPDTVLSLLRAVGSDLALRSPVRRRPPVHEAQLHQAAALGVWGAQLVASHPRAPDDLLITLAAHPSLAVLETLARRPHLPEAAAARLHEHPTSSIRQAAQDNPRLPRPLRSAR